MPGTRPFHPRTHAHSRCHLCTGAGRREQRQRKSPRRETTRGPADGRGERPPSRSAAARPRRAQGRAPETRGRGAPLFRSSKQAKRSAVTGPGRGPPPATLRLWVPLRAHSRCESSVNPAGKVCQAVGGGGAPRDWRGCVGFPGGRRREGGPGAAEPGRATGSWAGRPSPSHGGEQTRALGRGQRSRTGGGGRDHQERPGHSLPGPRCLPVCTTGRCWGHTLCRVQACSHTGGGFLAGQGGQVSSWPPASPAPPVITRFPPHTHTCTYIHMCRVRVHIVCTHSLCNVEGSSAMGTEDRTRGLGLDSHGTKFPEPQRWAQE